MGLFVSFGSHLTLKHLERLRREVKDSNHHILEGTPVAKYSTGKFETPASYQRFFNQFKQYGEENGYRIWAPFIHLAEKGALEINRLDPVLQQHPMTVKLGILSEENRLRKVSGKPFMRIHFEPRTDEILHQALNVGAFQNNTDLSFKKGNFNRFVENVRGLIQGRARHYPMRNFQILQLAQKLHDDDGANVSADLGSLHVHDFKRIAENSSMPFSFIEHPIVLNPMERLINDVCQGRDVEQISDGDIAKAGVSGILLPAFRMNVGSVDRFMGDVHDSDIVQLFNQLKGSHLSWNVVLGRWIQKIHEKK